MRWGLLLLVLVAQLLVNPCGDISHWWVTTINSLVVIALIYRLSFRWYHLLVGIVLGIPAVISYWVVWSPEQLLYTLIPMGLLYLYTILTTLVPLIKLRNIGPLELFGAIALYLLIGLTWSILYQIIDIVSHNSFTGGVGRLSFADFIYFSFTTLTTLGYGDIAPVTCIARALTSLEAVNGVLCLGVVIARAISLYTPSDADKEVDID